MEYGLRPADKDAEYLYHAVLILVVMEYGLRRLAEVTQTKDGGTVLILVVMEYGLRLWNYLSVGVKTQVLILVVMEYGLGRP